MPSPTEAPDGKLPHESIIDDFQRRLDPPHAPLLAKMNMVLHGIDADLSAHPGTSLLGDPSRRLKADVALCNPPFNMSDWGRDEVRDDLRWQYGIPPADNANFAFLQHVVSTLSPHGIAAVIMPDRAASTRRRSEADIRRRIIEADLIESIIAFPDQLFDKTQVPFTLWLLKRDKASGGSGHSRDRRGQTLFIDARKLGVKVDRTHKRLTDNDAARITDAFEAWRGTPGAGSYTDSPGFCASVETHLIAELGYVLTPSRYVGVADARTTQITENLKAAGWQVSRLADFVMHVEYLRSEKAPERATRIAELRNEKRLILPIEPHFDAAYGLVPESIIPNRCLLVSLLPQINGTFMAAWLNSADGRHARNAARPGTDRSPRTVSTADRSYFLNALVVPLPS